MTDPAGESGSLLNVCNTTHYSSLFFRSANCAGSVPSITDTPLGCFLAASGNNTRQCVANFSLSQLPNGTVVRLQYAAADNCNSTVVSVQAQPPKVCYNGMRTKCNDFEWVSQRFTDNECTQPTGKPSVGYMGCLGYGQSLCYGDEV